MIGSAILVFLWSGVKYLIGVAVAMMAFSNPFIGFLTCTAGAVTGVFVFTYGGLWIEEKLYKIFLKKGSHFNKRTRMLVRLKRSGGLPLVALLTPVFLSIPLGCIMATTFIHSRHKVVVYMVGSVVFWGVIFFGTLGIFDINLAEKLRFW